MPFVRRFALALLFSTAFASAQQTAPPPSAPATQDLPDSPGAQTAPPVEPTGPTAVLDTSMGRITCRLFDKQAPQTVANFIGLAEGTKDWTDPQTHEKEHGKPLYDGTTFHRVIPGFMAQGGDPMGNGMGDPGYYIQDEIDPSLMFDVPGRLAMANSGPNTDGSQFFVTEEIPAFAERPLHHLRAVRSVVGSRREDHHACGTRWARQAADACGAQEGHDRAGGTAAAACACR